MFKAHFHHSEIQKNIRHSKEEQYQGEFLIDPFVNVLDYLNSRMLTYIVRQNMITNAQAFPQILMTDIQTLKIPIIKLKYQNSFIERADQMLSLNKDLQEVSTKFQRVCVRKFENLNSNKKLQDWYKFSSGDFIKELSKQKIKLSLSEEAEYGNS